MERWWVDGHAVSTAPAFNGMKLVVDGQVLPETVPHRAHETAVRGVPGVTFRVKRGFGRNGLELERNGVIIPPSALTLKRKPVDTGMRCPAHQAHPATYGCAKCGTPVCATCEAPDAMRCGPCFEGARPQRLPAGDTAWIVVPLALFSLVGNLLAGMLGFAMGFAAVMIRRSQKPRWWKLTALYFLGLGAVITWVALYKAHGLVALQR